MSSDNKISVAPEVKNHNNPAVSHVIYALKTQDSCVVHAGILRYFCVISGWFSVNLKKKYLTIKSYYKLKKNYFHFQIFI